MEINVSRKTLEEQPITTLLHDAFQYCSNLLEQAVIFFDFPIYKELDDSAVYVQSMVASPKHGVIIFAVAESTKDNNILLKELDQVVSYVHSRLIRNPQLRSGRIQLNFPLTIAFFSNDPSFSSEEEDLHLIKNETQLESFLNKIELEKTIEQSVFSEIVSTVDGSKGLIRKTSRDPDLKEGSKGYYVKLLEDEISLFDHSQRHGFIVPTNGPQRIRGIAGSGKTVVLAMKAAITHLKFPTAKIVYTFYTKSLYQHVKRLITRFYRQFDDKDPNWEYVKIMHGWGGRSYPGVYYEACIEHGTSSLRYTDRKTEAERSGKSVFDVVCTEIKNTTKLFPIYDFVFIDEGQDFPPSFIDLCRQITQKERIVWAYDELQNIFNVKIPTQEDVFGKNKDGSPVAEIVEDTILYKSYRNPREILTVAHALGFGLYSNIVQKLENKEHWKDIGYKFIQGNCEIGEKTIIERPEETSTRTISENFKFSDIVKCKTFDEYSQEINFIANSIEDDLKDQLRPNDILVSIVDDRKAKRYATDLEKLLSEKNIFVNNTHRDSYGIIDFYLEGAVTISTIHKAKGNEAYQVYIAGIDYIFSNPDELQRNKIFTAITRAKAWATITGIGENAQQGVKEIKDVAKNFPRLVFQYPSEGDIKTMKRDMSKAAQKRQAAERAIDNALKMMSPEEIQDYLKKVKE